MSRKLLIAQNQSSDQTCPALLPYTGVHTLTRGVISLPPSWVDYLFSKSSITEVVCILVSLVKSEKKMTHQLRIINAIVMLFNTS